jgi:hypothetical protein
MVLFQGVRTSSSRNKELVCSQKNKDTVIGLYGIEEVKGGLAKALKKLEKIAA